MPGSIHHAFHGPKKNRFYGERWNILHKHSYNPDTDVKKDWQGVLQLTHAGERLRADVRGYFNARLEDDIRND